jgi:hypothetical protein
MASTRDRKRKAPEELSTNPNTIKSRKRIERMDEIEAIIETAKRNDVSAQTYAINKKLRLTEEYKNASKERQAEMEAETKERVNHKR